jgi:YHS domain-containing protein
LVSAGRVGAVADDDPKLPNCPVMGEPINLAVATETPEGPVYFCCAGCIKKFKASGDKYAEQIAEQRKVLAAWPKVQVKCPLDGKPVSDVVLEKDGNKTYFCSKECASKYESAPDQYKSGLANSFTHQTKCPISDRPIDPGTASTLPTGETIYYCCPKCDAQFRAQIDEFAPKLEKQGYVLNVARLKKELAAKKDKKGPHGQEEH